MSNAVTKKQRKAILKAIVKNKEKLKVKPYKAKFKLNQKISKALCAELLVEGFLILGGTDGQYTILALEERNVERYIQKNNTKD